MTHSVDMEQRYVPLDFTVENGTITATAPPNGNIAPPGVYMLFVVGSDGVPSVAKMVRVDETAPAPATPTITATSPASPANDNNPEVRGSGAEVASTVKVYGGANCSGPVLGSGSAATFNGTTGITVTVPADTTTDLRATATDVAGRASGCSDPVAYVEDSSGPSTAAEVSVDGSTATTTFSSEANATFECDLDAGGFAGCRSPSVYTGLSAGTHSLEVRARDATGNPDPTPARRTFEIVAPPPPGETDSTPPQTRILKGPKRAGTKREARFRFGSSEPSPTFRCTLDGAVRRCGAQVSMKVGRGTHKLTVAAGDAAGNTDSSPATYSWRVNRSRR